jgi:hypothetical protein
MTRLIVAIDTRTPDVSSYQARVSSSVASGCAASRAGNAAAKGAVLIGGGPWRGRGATAPVWRRSCRYRVSVARETPKTRATSLRGIPPSTAATTRSRRSSE